MKNEADVQQILDDLEVLIDDRGFTPPEVWGMQQMLRYILEKPANRRPTDKPADGVRSEAIDVLRSMAARIRARRASQERAQRQ